jgi:ABC-type sugar transport system ATPase subunit
VSSLSGGNQQKVALARWLASGAQVLILVEPAQGVDIGARFEFYEEIAALSRARVAVLLISSDITEALGLAHRVLVMRSGRVVAELDGDPARAGEVLSHARHSSRPIGPA